MSLIAIVLFACKIIMNSSVLEIISMITKSCIKMVMIVVSKKLEYKDFMDKDVTGIENFMINLEIMYLQNIAKNLDIKN